jgi:periplasmic mercuric ion binding protein
MKHLKIFATTALLLSGVAVSFAQTTTETIKVSGNCGSCEKHIETAAKKAGAADAKWDKKTKVLTVSFDASKTSDDKIQQTIAAAGYDTEKYAGDQKAYESLDECCQYENKKKTAKN